MEQNQQSRLPELPECPACGCNDTRYETYSEMGDDLLGTYHCNHCSHEYQDETVLDNAGSVPEVIYNVTRCPHCRSTDTIVTRGPRGKARQRYHECRQCLNTFRSVQIL